MTQIKNPMALYRFKISFEDYEDVYREIEIRSVQTFADLHACFHTSISFDGSKPSSFYMSNDHWLKGREITSHPKQDKNGKNVPLMKDSLLSEYIADPRQKIYYIIDPDNVWTFHIELLKIIPSVDMKLAYPRVAKSSGEAPKQFAVTVPLPGMGEEDDLIVIDEPVEEEDAIVDAIDADELGEDAIEVGEKESEDEEATFDDVEMGGEEEDK